MQDSTAVICHEDVHHATLDVENCVDEPGCSARKISKPISENADLNRNDSINYDVSGNKTEIRLSYNDSQCWESRASHPGDTVNTLRTGTEYVETTSSHESQKCNNELISVEAVSVNLKVPNKISVGNETDKLNQSVEMSGNISRSTRSAFVVDNNNAGTLAPALDKIQTIPFSCPMPTLDSDPNVSDSISRLTTAEDVVSINSTRSRPNSCGNFSAVANSIELNLYQKLKSDVSLCYKIDNTLQLSNQLNTSKHSLSTDKHGSSKPVDVVTCSSVTCSSVSEKNNSDMDCVMDLRYEVTASRPSYLLSLVDAELNLRDNKTFASRSSTDCSTLRALPQSFAMTDVSMLDNTRSAIDTHVLPEFMRANKYAACDRLSGNTKDHKTQRLDSVVKDLSIRADDRNTPCGLTMTSSDTDTRSCAPQYSSPLNICRNLDLVCRQDFGPQFAGELADVRNYSSLLRSTSVPLKKLRNSKPSDALSSICVSDPGNINKQLQGGMYEFRKDEVSFDGKVLTRCEDVPGHLERQSIARSNQDCNRFIDDCSQISIQSTWRNNRNDGVISTTACDESRALNLSMTAKSSDNESSLTALNLTSNRMRTAISSGTNDQDLMFPAACQINPSCPITDSMATIKVAMKTSEVLIGPSDEGKSSKRSNLMSFNDVFLNHLKKTDDKTVCIDNMIPTEVDPVSTVPRPLVSCPPSTNQDPITVSDTSCSQNLTKEVPEVKGLLKGRRKKRVNSEFVAELMLCASRTNRSGRIYDRATKTTFIIPDDVPFVMSSDAAKPTLVNVSLTAPLDVTSTKPVEQIVTAIQKSGGRRKKPTSKIREDFAKKISSGDQCVFLDSVSAKHPAQRDESASMSINTLEEVLQKFIPDEVTYPNVPKKSRVRNAKGKGKQVKVPVNINEGIVSNKATSLDMADVNADDARTIATSEFNKKDIDLLNTVEAKIFDKVSDGHVKLDDIVSNVDKTLCTPKKSTKPRKKKLEVKSDDTVSIPLSSKQDSKSEIISTSTETTAVVLPKKEKKSRKSVKNVSQTQSNITETGMNSTLAGDEKLLVNFQNVVLDEKDTQQLTIVQDSINAVIADECNTTKGLTTELPSQSKDVVILESLVKPRNQKAKRNSKCKAKEKLEEPAIVVFEPVVYDSEPTEYVDFVTRKLENIGLKGKKKIADLNNMPAVEVNSKLSAMPLTQPTIKESKVSRSKSKKKCVLSELLVEDVHMMSEQVSKESEHLETLQNDRIGTISNEHIKMLKEPTLDSVTDLSILNLADAKTNLTKPKRKSKQKSKSKNHNASEQQVDPVSILIEQPAVSNIEPVVQPTIDNQLIKSKKQLALERKAANLLVNQTIVLNSKSASPPSLDIVYKESKSVGRNKSKKVTFSETQIHQVNLVGNQQVVSPQLSLQQVLSHELTVETSTNVGHEKSKPENISKKLKSISLTNNTDLPPGETNNDVSNNLSHTNETCSQNIVKPISRIKKAKRSKAINCKSMSDGVVIPPSTILSSNLRKVEDDEECNRRIMETLANMTGNTSAVISKNDSKSASGQISELGTRNYGVKKADDSDVTLFKTVSLNADVPPMKVGESTVSIENNCSFMNVINDVAKCPKNAKEDKDGLVDDGSESDRPFVCPRCRYRARKKGQLRKHLGVHGIYSCAHCEFTSDGHVGLDEHMADHHPSRCGRRLCKRCHVLFRLDLIDAHESECTGVKCGWDCTACGKRFKFVSAMRTHLRRWHSTDTQAGVTFDSSLADTDNTKPDGYDARDVCGVSKGVSCSLDIAVDMKETENLVAVISSDELEQSSKLPKKKGANLLIKCDSCSKRFKLQQSLEKHESLKHGKVNASTHSENPNILQCTTPEELILQSPAVIANPAACHAPMVVELTTEDAGDKLSAPSTLAVVLSITERAVDQPSVGETENTEQHQLEVTPTPPVRLYCRVAACGKEFKKVRQLHRHAEKHIGGGFEIYFNFCKS